MQGWILENCSRCSKEVLVAPPAALPMRASELETICLHLKYIEKLILDMVS